MTFYSAVHPRINYSVTYEATHSFKLFCYELLQTNGIKWHLACSAQSTRWSLKAVKSFRINFCWKFRVLSVSLKWLLPLLFELNGPTMQHNLYDGALVLLQRAQLMLPFIVSCVCGRVQKTQNKNVCFSLLGWMATYLSLPSIQTPTVYSGFSDFSHSVGSGFPLPIHATTAQRCDESKIPKSTVSNFLQTALYCCLELRTLPEKMVLSPSGYRN